MGLKYYKRLKVYKTSTGHCDFDPSTGLGHSYRWYELTKKIKGKLVLNTYRYSVTTSKHIWDVRCVLKSLGLSYVSFEAPRGLQNLEAAFEHTLEKVAALEVKAKYQRKSKDFGAVNAAKRELELIAKLGGFKVTKKKSLEAFKDAEAARVRRLQDAKQRKIELAKRRAEREAARAEYMKRFSNASDDTDEDAPTQSGRPSLSIVKAEFDGLPPRRSFADLKLV